MLTADNSATSATGLCTHDATSVCGDPRRGAGAVDGRAERDRAAVHEQHAPVDERLDVAPGEQPEDEHQRDRAERDRRQPELLAAEDPRRERAQHDHADRSLAHGRSAHLERLLLDDRVGGAHDAMSIGKKKFMITHAATSSPTTIGHAVIVHWRNE